MFLPGAIDHTDIDHKDLGNHGLFVNLKAQY